MQEIVGNETASGLQRYRRGVIETKHAAILKAARHIFLERGYTHAGMTEIAHEADVSTATLYKHFGSKEALFSAVVKEAGELDVEDLAILPATAPLAEQLGAAARLFLVMQFDQKMNALLRLVIGEVPVAPLLARKTYEDVIGGRRAFVSSVFDHLIAQGQLKPHDTKISAMFVAGMMKEIFVWPALFDANFVVPENTDETIREIVAVFLTRYGM